MKITICCNSEDANERSLQLMAHLNQYVYQEMQLELTLFYSPLAETGKNPHDNLPQPPQQLESPQETSLGHCCPQQKLWL
ncbi:hypothetical protein Y032_0042g703 [Ancylostoma ceylanicum]|uniref:Uncharacterized protein n=1 Tax=Ancylostoma ceylanicum TaxID=53326 RepID=A0A016UH05_9BILA|nr:hypothetical protein Y032_0042g703 [Ancylostoma ceylanicum]